MDNVRNSGPVLVPADGDSDPAMGTRQPTVEEQLTRQDDKILLLFQEPQRPKRIWTARDWL